MAKFWHGCQEMETEDEGEGEDDVGSQAGVMVVGSFRRGVFSLRCSSISKLKFNTQNEEGEDGPRQEDGQADFASLKRYIDVLCDVTERRSAIGDLPRRAGAQLLFLSIV